MIEEIKVVIDAVVDVSPVWKLNKALGELNSKIFSIRAAARQIAAMEKEWDLLSKAGLKFKKQGDEVVDIIWKNNKKIKDFGKVARRVAEIERMEARIKEFSNKAVEDTVERLKNEIIEYEKKLPLMGKTVKKLGRLTKEELKQYKLNIKRDKQERIRLKRSKEYDRAQTRKIMNLIGVGFALNNLNRSLISLISSESRILPLDEQMLKLFPNLQDAVFDLDSSFMEFKASLMAKIAPVMEEKVIPFLDKLLDLMTSLTEGPLGDLTSQFFAWALALTPIIAPLSLMLGGLLSLRQLIKGVPEDFKEFAIGAKKIGEKVIPWLQDAWKSAGVSLGNLKSKITTFGKSAAKVFSILSSFITGTAIPAIISAFTWMATHPIFTALIIIASLIAAVWIGKFLKLEENVTKSTEGIVKALLWLEISAKKVGAVIKFLAELATGWLDILLGKMKFEDVYKKMTNTLRDLELEYNRRMTEIDKRLGKTTKNLELFYETGIKAFEKPMEACQGFSSAYEELSNQTETLMNQTKSYSNSLSDLSKLQSEISKAGISPPMMIGGKLISLAPPEIRGIPFEKEKAPITIGELNIEHKFEVAPISGDVLANLEEFRAAVKEISYETVKTEIEDIRREISAR